MASSLNTPKVFISYSWKPATNKQKTLALAERMVNDGVNVILDEWNLAEGQDKYQFMEQMVVDPEIKRVLIICNKDYKEKADLKKGGVGTESLIISDKIYKQADQIKFIPIIFEKDEMGEAYVSTFINSRIYIDLSSDDVFEYEYEKLLRNIFDKPATRKPAIGTPPAYLIETEPIFLKTAHKVKAIQTALINEKKNSQTFINDYYISFIDCLDDFEIKDSELLSIEFIDEEILKKIDSLKPLRNDFISFLETIFTYSIEFNIDKFLEFLESLLEFSFKLKNNNYSTGTIGKMKSDHYKFFFSELFLYLATVMIEKEKFKELGVILNSDYVFFNPESGKTEAYSFIILQSYIESLDKYRNNRLQLRRVSITYDILKQRADNSKYTFEKLKQCDCILYYISLFKNEVKDPWIWHRWWPNTTLSRIHQLPILEKMASLRHFDKIKSLFEVSTIEELKQKILKVKELQVDKIERIHYDLPFIYQAFNFDQIGIYR